MHNLDLERKVLPNFEISDITQKEYEASKDSNLYLLNEEINQKKKIMKLNQILILHQQKLPMKMIERLIWNEEKKKSREEKEILLKVRLNLLKKKMNLLRKKKDF